MLTHSTWEVQWGKTEEAVVWQVRLFKFICSEDTLFFFFLSSQLSQYGALLLRRIFLFAQHFSLFCSSTSTRHLVRARVCQNDKIAAVAPSALSAPRVCRLSILQGLVGDCVRARIVRGEGERRNEEEYSTLSSWQVALRERERERERERILLTHSQIIVKYFQEHNNTRTRECFCESCFVRVDLC